MGEEGIGRRRKRYSYPYLMNPRTRRIGLIEGKIKPPVGSRRSIDIGVGIGSITSGYTTDIVVVVVAVVVRCDRRGFGFFHRLNTQR